MLSPLASYQSIRPKEALLIPGVGLGEGVGLGLGNGVGLGDGIGVGEGDGNGVGEGDGNGVGEGTGVGEAVANADAGPDGDDVEWVECCACNNVALTITHARPNCRNMPIFFMGIS